jgi:hypothetical protein
MRFAALRNGGPRPTRAASGTMRDALNSTGREIYFSLCGWNAWCVPAGPARAG